MKRVDLNCDLGESFGNYRIGMDEAVIPHISSANIACGWHGGDPMVLRHTMEAGKNRRGSGWEPIRDFPIFWGLDAEPSRSPLRKPTATPFISWGRFMALPGRRGFRCSTSNPMGRCTIWRPKIWRCPPPSVRPFGILTPISSCWPFPAARCCKRPRRWESHPPARCFADRAYNEDGSLVSRSLLLGGNPRYPGVCAPRYPRWCGRGR